MYKIWTIAWKEIYLRFTDRNLLLIMIATPLAISTIVGLAFGGLGGGDIPIRDIPIAIVNHDSGISGGYNFGEVYVTLLVEGEPGSAEGTPLPPCDLANAGATDVGEVAAAGGVTLFDLTEAVAFDAATARDLVASEEVPAPMGTNDEDSDAYVDAVARSAVEGGVYTAAVFIPPGFTENLTGFAEDGAQDAAPQVTVFANTGQPISAGIVHSIVEGITNQLLTGTITIAATFGQVVEDLGPQAAGGAASSMDFATAFSCAFTPASNTIQLEASSVGSSEDQNLASLLLVSVGSAQAMFFALFTAQFGVLSMYDERRQWTLQRLITSPTPRSYILAGKLIGVFVSVLFQLLVLMIALSVVGSLMEGTPTLIWGSDLLAIGLVLVAASLAVSGFGMFLAGIATTPEQGQLFGSVLNMGLAVLGGAFGFTLPRQIAAISLLYWGRDAFDQLATGGSQIGLNVLVLAGQGLALYLIGLILFNRRFKV
jgi:ABC-type transport system involved in multi-copper enzyme maturation permease subunit